MLEGVRGTLAAFSSVLLLNRPQVARVVARLETHLPCLNRFNLLINQTSSRNCLHSLRFFLTRACLLLNSEKCHALCGGPVNTA